MSDVMTFHAGSGPLLISVPHDGRKVPRDLRARMTAEGRVLPDTDWHVARLYEFARGMGANLLVANYSRYVVDLNRPTTGEALYAGQMTTGICPQHTFSGDPIYSSAGPDAAEIGKRIETYWTPYHDQIAATLETIRERYGYALLWDAHSIPSRVPLLFNGELPALNIGTFGGHSCGAAIETALTAAAAGGPYSYVVNGRFQGGFITRHYGDKNSNVHAVQLEIAQRVYMDEDSCEYDAQKASRLRDTLRHLLETFIETARRG
jgi:N-formylglutamate amidohydrolase